MRCEVNVVFKRRMGARWIAGAIVALSVVAQSVLAQSGSAVHATPRVASDSSSPGVVSELSPDTGRTLPAHVDWSRYVVPSMCLAASRNVQHLSDRLTLPGDPRYRWTSDSSLYRPERDTLSTEAVQASRACGRHFRADQVSVVELPSLLWLALRMRNDSLARAVVARQVELAHGIPAKGEALRDAIETYLYSRPPRLDLALAAMGQLNALGPAAHVAQLRGHIALERYYRPALTDYADAILQADSAMPLGQLMTADEMKDGEKVWEIWLPYDEKMQMMLLDNPDSIPGLVSASIEAMRKPGGMFPTLVKVRAGTYSYSVKMIGKPSRRVSGAHVYNGAPSDSFPRRGHMTVMVQAPEDWREANSFEARAVYAAIHRLRKTYGDSLDIVLFAHTMGWTPGSLHQTPDEEAESIRTYFLDEQKLPVILVVAESPATRFPDGRVQYGQPSYQSAFPPVGFGPLLFVVVGADGVVRGIAPGVFPHAPNVSASINGAIDRLVRRTLTRPN